jgi:hypothetical protein
MGLFGNPVIGQNLSGVKEALNGYKNPFLSNGKGPAAIGGPK